MLNVLHFSLWNEGGAAEAHHISSKDTHAITRLLLSELVLRVCGILGHQI